MQVFCASHVSILKWSHDFVSQIRSSQFDDFPSNWSEAKEIEFVVIGRPNAVQGLEIDFTRVDGVCKNNQASLELDGRAVWSAACVSVQEGTTFEYYELIINDFRNTSVSIVVQVVIFTFGHSWWFLGFLC